MKMPVFSAPRRELSPEPPRFAHYARRAPAMLGMLLVAAAFAVVTFVVAGRADDFLRRSDFFEVRQIRIDGASEVLGDQVRDVIAQLKGRGEINLLTFNIERASFQVQNLPRVRQVQFRRIFPHTLAVDIEERQPLTVANVGELFWIDREGVLLGRAEARDAALIRTPILTGLRGNRFYTGLRVEQPRLVELLEAVDFLHSHSPQLAEKFSEWNLNPQDEITGILRDGVEVRFGERPLLERLPVLDALFAHRTDIAKFTYVDLRFDSQIVYL
jgi:cell division protein FtsQ